MIQILHMSTVDVDADVDADVEAVVDGGGGGGGERGWFCKATLLQVN